MDRPRATVRQFPRSPSNRSASEVPSYTPAASPRLRRRLSPWPPHRWSYTASELTNQPSRMVTRCTPTPYPPGWRPASLLRSVEHWFTRITPSGLAERARTVWQYQRDSPSSGPLATLTSVSPDQAALRLLPGRCDGPAGKVSHPSSINQRLRGAPRLSQLRGC